MNLFASLGWGDATPVQTKPKPKVVVQILDHCFYCDSQLPSSGKCINAECKLNIKQKVIENKIYKQLEKREATIPIESAVAFEDFFADVDKPAKKLGELHGKPWWDSLTAPQRKSLIDKLSQIKTKSNLDESLFLEREIEGIRALGKEIKGFGLAERLQNLEGIKLPTYVVKEKYKTIPRSSDIETRRKLNSIAVDSESADAYNSYSGKGKLSDVKFKECADFADYTDKKKEFEIGQFFTPDWLCKEIIGVIQPEKGSLVADICCGIGRFFNYVPDCKVLGYEPDRQAGGLAQNLFRNGRIYTREMIDFLPCDTGKVDYAVGNPPFNLYYWVDDKHPLRSQGEQVVSQDDYVYNNCQLLKVGGAFAFIVPKTWLTNELLYGKINNYIKENFYFIAELELPDDTFQEYQIKFPTKIIFLVKRIPDFEFPLEKFEGKLIEFISSPQCEWYHGLKAEIKKHKAVKTYLDRRESIIEDEKEKKLDGKLKKLICTIKNVLPDKVDDMITKITNEIKSLEHVSKPWDMKEKEWRTRKPTKEKIFKKYQKQVCRKHIKELWIQICKDKHHIKITTSNAQASAVLNEWLDSKDWNTKSMPIWKLIIPYHNKVSTSFTKILGLLKRQSLSTKPSINHPAGKKVKVISSFNLLNFIFKKKDEFELNRADLSKMEALYPKEYAINKAKLEPMVFPDKEFGEIKLLPHQVEDLSAFLIKDRALLSWSMGLGKTIAGLVWANEKGKQTLIVAPACNLIDPWQQEINQRLPGTDFLVVTKRKDWQSYTGKERFLVVSLEALPMYEKFVAKYKFDTLILDESDNIKNKASKRAKVLKKLAKRCKKTLCMTGTPTRNNAVEIYNQAELLLNNSATMLCTVETIKEYDRYNKEFRSVNNPLYMEPYPAHGGLSNFRKCFSPRKTTVFGAEKTNQTIFNKKELEEFMKPIRMTRIFEDEKPRIDKILGRKINQGKDSDIHQELVKMNKYEGEVYKFILDEFVKELQAYFIAKGHDSKTAKMLIIVRQIMSLLQAVSHPWTFASYNGPEVTSKMERIKEIFNLAKKENRKVLFGSPWVPTVDHYEEYFSREMPVFVIKQAMSKLKRSQVINEYKAYPNFAILMGTIGCLKSGLSIPEVSVVVTDSLTWNWATYNQFISRAIRLTSKQTVDVYAVCNEGSFDVNVFSLMMKKEKINQYIRRGIEGGDKELLDKFGASTDIFDEAVKMVKTRINGKVVGHIEWNDGAVIEDGIAPTEHK